MCTWRLVRWAGRQAGLIITIILILMIKILLLIIMVVISKCTGRPAGGHRDRGPVTCTCDPAEAATKRVCRAR